MAGKTQATVSSLLQVRIIATDLVLLRRRAKANEQTLAEYVRDQLGVPDPPRGGAREGAGRQKKQGKHK